jgi:hypothetical protein
MATWCGDETYAAAQKLVERCLAKDGSPVRTGRSGPWSWPMRSTVGRELRDLRKLAPRFSRDRDARKPEGREKEARFRIGLNPLEKSASWHRGAVAWGAT